MQLFPAPGLTESKPLKRSTKSDGRLVLKSEFSAVREQAQKQVSFLAVMLYTGPDPEKPRPAGPYGRRSLVPGENPVPRRFC